MTRGRCVFWRRPDGKPYGRDDDKCAPVTVLAELGRAASLDGKGGVTWPLFETVGFRAALEGSLVIVDPEGEELNELDASRILRSAVNEIIRKKGAGKPISPRELLRRAAEKAKKHFQLAVDRYVLVTSLSVSGFPAKRITVCGCTVSPLASRDHFRYPDTLQQPRRNTPIRGSLGASNYQIVRVGTFGRTIHEAAQSALDALTLLRGIWTLFATYRSWSIGSAPRSAGAIFTGPVHTLHTPAGPLATDSYWYESEYTEERELFASGNRWQTIEKHRRWAMRRMSRLPYRHDLHRLIARYVTALDQANFDVGFLQLWSILERLTETTGRHYDETIRRTVWPFEDRDLAREMLQSVRVRRNRFVHAACSTENADQIVFLIKQFVEPHLVRLIRNDFHVSTLEEYAQHLALPTSLEKLRRDRRRLDRAIRTVPQGQK